VTPDDLDLLAPYPPLECAARLTAAIDVDRFLSLSAAFGSKPVIGNVSDTSLRLRKRIRYRNGFQTHFSGTMRAEGRGTRISGTFGPHPSTRIFALLLLGMFGVFEVVALASLFQEGSSNRNGALLALVPPGMMAMMYAIFRFGRFLARHEAQFLADFLRRTLTAR
jgi:hypothetical protein